jgi:amino acid adenylation domain-containing protein
MKATTYPRRSGDTLAATLVDLLEIRAREHPEKVAFSLLVDDGSIGESWTYEELARRARSVAGLLHGHAEIGDRAVLIYPFGLDFVAAFLGCLYAGVVAVPAYPPRRNRPSERLAAVVRDCLPRVALTTPELAAVLERSASGLPPGVELLAPSYERSLERAPRGIAAESLAFLQYTSGSTSSPKGVEVTHGQLMHNEEAIRQAFGQSEDSRIVGWLPLHHDMGLIGNVLQTIYVGGECLLLPPLSFLQRPLRWLEAVSRYRATTSGGPNFAYELCLRRLGDPAAAGLDLSHWQVAFCGAEPVRAATLERFARAFASCGFRRTALYPCYGLAESTLFVTGGEPGAGARIESLDAAALERGRAEPARDPRSLNLVGCGRNRSAQRLKIVDATTLRELPAGQVGEIWLCGESVAGGYWRRPEESAQTFGARLDDGEGPYLRTGDLGFVTAGELFVTGRIKDLIIVRGRNLYPQDLELTVEASSAAIRSGGVAAFSVESGGEERIVVVCDVRRGGEFDADEVGTIVRSALAAEHEVSILEVVFVPIGTVPKTTSGKVQRRACRQAYLEGSLPVLARSGESAPRDQEGEPAESGLALSPAPGAMANERLYRLLNRLRVPGYGGEAPPDPHGPLGLDSLQAIELGLRIEQEWGVGVDPAILLGGASFGDLLAAIERGTEADESRLGPERLQRESAPLTAGQSALLFLEQLAEGLGVNNLACTVRVRADLDLQALERAANRLALRHPSLRSTFSSEEGTQRFAPRMPLRVIALDGSSLTDEELSESAAKAAYRPFDVSRGPIWRIVVWSRTTLEHLILFSIHHLAVDFWSFGQLFAEIGTLYGEEIESGGFADTRAAAGIDFGDVATREAAFVASPAAEPDWRYWGDRLAGDLPVLDLPTDRPRPALQTFRGATRFAAFDADLSQGLRSFARSLDATPFAFLCALFSAWLERITGAEDLVLGVPMANRRHADELDVVGYLINPLPLRCDYRGNPKVGRWVGDVQRSIAEMLEHQALPFPLLAGRYQPVRDPSRSPIFQALFGLHQTRPGVDAALSAIALGLPGVRTKLGPLSVETVALNETRLAVDLTVNVAVIDGSYRLGASYNVDLFDAATIDRFLASYRTLVAGALVDRDACLDGLELLTQGERSQLLRSGRGPSLDGAFLSVPARFAAQVAAAPEALAVADEEGAWTYRELDAASALWASRLRAAGVSADVRIGVCWPRDRELVALLLGTLRAGGAYVPVDPEHPIERSAAVLSDATVAIVVAKGERGGELAARVGRPLLGPAAADAIGAFNLPRTLEPPAIDPAQLAYVLYTSGSTGRPKGVQVDHEAFSSFIATLGERLGAGPGETLLAVTTVTFDIAALELFLPLATGGSVWIASRQDASDGKRLHTALRSARAVRMQATPATWRSLIDAGWEGDPCIDVLCGGEAMPPDLAAELLKRGRTVWNLYGPTETTIWSTAARLGGKSRTVPLGEPIAGTSIAVVDRRGRLAPLGVPGELWIGGKGVARGYFGRPGLSAERFVPDPFSGRSGARAYRTGDLVRYRADGALEFLGRFDHQVKVRGYRIELGEIEAVLAACSEVKETVVAVQEGVGGPWDRRLVAYAAPASLRVADLRNHLEARLPGYMVPALFVLLDRLPRSTSGKVDRRHLPVPSLSGAGTSRRSRTPIEEALCGIFAQVLDRPEVSIDDDFFGLGGHSLLAGRVVSRIAATLRREVPLVALFRSPTVAQLAIELGAETDPRLPGIEPLAFGAVQPLSYPQQRLWFLDRLEPAGAVYNLPHAARLAGRFDPAAFARAFARVTARHEPLRTVFAFSPDHGGQPTQRVLPAMAPHVPRLDFRRLDPTAREGELKRSAEAEARRPFDLERGPVVRLWTGRLQEEEWAIGWVAHHIACDGWSMGVMLQDLSAAYGDELAGVARDLPPLPIRYADYAAWQRRHLPRPEDVAYWAERLVDLPALELPRDRARPLQEAYRGSKRLLRCPAHVLAALKRFTRERFATPFMVLSAVFQVLLGRSARQVDFGLGTPIANRARPELEGLIGCFVNTLVLRSSLAANVPFGALVERVKASSLEAFDHQDMPFERLVEELRPERDHGRNPLFQAMFLLQNAPLPPLALGEAELVPFDVDTKTSKFDLTLALGEVEGEFSGWLESAQDLFDPASAERFAGRFWRLLESSLAAPETSAWDLPWLSPEEEGELRGWSRTEGPEPIPARLSSWVELSARRNPVAIAMVWEGEEMSYAELFRLSRRLACKLRRLGVGADVPVAIALRRSPEQVVAVLATLDAGGCYLPLDPGYPLERLRLMIQDARPLVILGHPDQLEALAGEVGAAELLTLPAIASEHGWQALDEPEVKGFADPGSEPENLAYVMYTSGSTGRPKGVAMPNRALVNLIDWQGRQSLRLAEDRGIESRIAPRTLQYSSLSFDVSCQELFATWGWGGSLVLVSEEVRRDPVALMAHLDRHRVERLFLPFVALQALAAVAIGLPDERQPRSLREIHTAGEALQATPQIREWIGRLGAVLTNQYGPTETHVCSWERLGEDPVLWLDRPAIGRPIANHQVYVLDGELRSVPVGVPGELWLAGRGLARGYLGQPDLTAERFLPDSQALDGTPGARMYRSGDLGRRLVDGRLDYLGRVDDQVKIRGYRIEPAEIEVVLAGQPGVLQSAVVVRSGRNGERHLVAYVVARSIEEGFLSRVRDALARALPEYLVPSIWMELPALPLTPSGKVARRALPEPDLVQAVFVPPATPVEGVIGEIWSEVLGIERIGRQDDFFALGGHSLLATRVVARAQEAFGVEIPMRRLFDTPDLAGFSAVVDAALMERIEGLSDAEAEGLLQALSDRSVA